MEEIVMIARIMIQLIMEYLSIGRKKENEKVCQIYQKFYS
jgi:hypothetical protein